MPTGVPVARSRNLKAYAPTQMKPVARETVFGGYRGDAVMVIAMDDINDVDLNNAMCEIEYYAPLARTPVGTRKIVHLNGIEHIFRRGVSSS